MILIVGLGNPGAEYEHTRHNIGWSTLNRFIDTEHLPSLVRSSPCNARISEGMFFGKEVTVLLPLTFMNKSGVSVATYLKTHTTSHTVVAVHDDIDLPFGTVRVSVGRGAGGHNGVRSLIEHLGGEKLVRVRVGIGKKNLFGVMKRPTGDALSRFVLTPFTTREEKELEHISGQVSEALTLITTKGVEAAMQVCNQAH